LEIPLQGFPHRLWPTECCRYLRHWGLNGLSYCRGGEPWCFARFNQHQIETIVCRSNRFKRIQMRRTFARFDAVEKPDWRGIGFKRFCPRDKRRDANASSNPYFRPAARLPLETAIGASDLGLNAWLQRWTQHIREVAERFDGETDAPVICRPLANGEGMRLRKSRGCEFYECELSRRLPHASARRWRQRDR